MECLIVYVDAETGQQLTQFSGTDFEATDADFVFPTAAHGTVLVGSVNGNKYRLGIDDTDPNNPTFTMTKL